MTSLIDLLSSDAVSSDLRDELNSYILTIDNAAVRQNIELQIVKCVADFDASSGLVLRDVCMSVMFPKIIYYWLKVPFGGYTKRLCKCAFDMFGRNNYKKIKSSDRSFVSNVNYFDVETVEFLFNYRFSNNYDETIFNDFVDQPDRLLRILGQLQQLCPLKTTSQLLDYIFRFENSCSGWRVNKEFLSVESCRILLDNEVDFFEIIDNLYGPDNRRINAGQFNIFARNLAKLAIDHDLYWQDVFGRDTHINMSKPKKYIRALANGVPVSMLDSAIAPS